MGTLTSRPVTRVSARPSTGATYRSTGVAYDWAIGGLPFLAATADDRPLTRKTATYRKDQFDAGSDPGEQSLVFWWLRSQTSFHGGAGVKFVEQNTNDQYGALVAYRFYDSRGVDPFSVQGQVTLLKTTQQLKAATGSVLVHGCVDSSGTDIALQAEGANLYRVTAAGSATAITWGGTGTILSICDDGTNYYVLDSAGVYKGTLAGGAGTKIYNLSGSRGLVAWVKQRLMLALDNSVYELNVNAGAGTALPTAKYAHPNTNWRWTAATETPQAILFAGFVGDTSQVYKFTLDATGAVPTLVGAGASAVLPEGELCYGLYGYLGTYVAIGTNRGVRVATVDSNGDLSWGPLVFTTTAPVRDFVGRGGFILCAAENQIDGNSGLYVIDLSVATAFRKYAYATHLQAHVPGQVSNVQLLGASGRLLFGVDGQGSYVEHTTNLEPTGWLQTGNIRFHTIENKLFKYLRMRSLAITGGSLAATVNTPDGNSTPVVSYSSGIPEESALPTNVGPQEYVSLTFTFTSATTVGPTFTGYQVKALPAQKRQRLYVIPMLCFDFEVDKNGMRSGAQGSAVKRLSALEALEEAADLVLLQDLNQNPTSARLVVIDDITFEQKAPPGKFSGWGGVITLTLRAVT